MKILRAIRSIDPAGGGVIESVNQVSALIEAMGHSVELLSLDAPEDLPSYAPQFKTHAVGPGRGGYGYTRRFDQWMQAHAQLYDAIIVDGIWQYHSLATRRWAKRLSVPYYVFPHGMLDPWFKREYPLKHLKKWLYWPWAEYRVLRDARRVLFTCEEERIQAAQSFGMYRCVSAVVGLGTTPPPLRLSEAEANFRARFPQVNNRRVCLFLGRIHPKKGCDLLIRAFAAVLKEHEDWILVIAGPDQIGWMGELRSIADSLGISDRIVWTGLLQEDLRWGALKTAEMTVLPSHQENYGMIFSASLAVGVPVLISDKVNIWREILASDAGLVAADTIEGTKAILEQWVNKRDSERAAMTYATVGCFRKHFDAQRAASRLIEVLQSSVSSSP